MNRLFVVSFFLSLGCKATVIGTSCHRDGDCNVSGQHCVAGFDGKNICTHTCSGQTGTDGCPIGYDCGLSNQDVGLTCNKAPYAFDATGAPLLYGKSCALDASVCQNTGDPNRMPMCRKGPQGFTTDPLENDPLAFCTGTCSKDLECPVGFTCTKDYDGVMKCLTRILCDACLIDDDCPAEFPECVPTSDGSARYCTKSCKDSGDCGGAQGNFLVCSNSTNIHGDAGSYCLHRAGRCVGNGQICDPCRTEDDCTASGSHCFEYPTTLERFCTINCGSDQDCAGPNGALCQQSNNICAGAAVQTNPGTIGCY